MYIAPDCGRNLPDVFTCLDGEKVTRAEQWTGKRREEVLELFRKHEYGRLPDMSDVTITMRVADVRCDHTTMRGAAIRKTIEITAERRGVHFSFPAVIFIPVSANKPLPCFLTICNTGIQHGDPARKFLNAFWPAETIVSQGYATCIVHARDIAPDYDEGFTTGFHKLFPDLTGENRPGDAWGTLGAWSWGASRLMDYFETDNQIDETKVAVVGHSRGGKTAMWAAAQDQRFAMAISSSAGNSGDALSRQSQGETIADITRRFPFWFCKNYQQFADNESALPMDQHMLVSLIAPRLLYTTSKTFDAWADPKGQFESLVQATPVYRLLGTTGMPALEQPDPETPLLDGEIGYHFKTGFHNLDEYDWNMFLEFAKRHV